DSPLRDSFFGGTRLPDGGVLLVGVNAAAVRSDAALQVLKPYPLTASETLADVALQGRELIAVGRRGAQDLGALP
ncbi:MAG: hypothetical protein ACREVL_11050, partial [Solimonas sp.]